MLSQMEYEQYARRAAFEALLAGEERPDLANLLDLEPGSYALVRFAVPGGAEQLKDALLGHFLKYPEYILLDWGVREYLVIIKAMEHEMDRCIGRCAAALAEHFGAYGPADWHAALTPPVAGAEALPECYETLSRLWAHRYLLPGEHLLTRETVGQAGDEEERLLALTDTHIDPQRLREIMENAAAGEVPGLVSRMLAELGDALGSESFCRYLALGCRFSAVRFAEERGCDRRGFIQSCRLSFPTEGRLTAAVLSDYLIRVLQGAIRVRDGETGHACRGVLRQAVAYVDIHFNREGMSLERVAAAVELSPNYLSALFSREMGCTFIEYVTKKRMELARELLETTKMRSAEVAGAVGYRDARYFSALFRKTQGMTPRAYRSSRKSANG